MSRKTIVQAVLVFVGTVLAALTPSTADGISQAELLSALVAGVSATLALLKNSPLNGSSGTSTEGGK